MKKLFKDKKVGTLFKDALKTIAKNTKSVASNTKQFITETFKTEGYLKDSNDFVYVCPRVYWMAFPTQSKIKELSSFLNATFGSYYYVWNVSENNYDTGLFRNQVAEFNFVGYPCTPLAVLFSICSNIIEWLNADRNNVAIIHCQDTHSRSALLVACLLVVMKEFGEPIEALRHFSNKMKLSDETILFPSQRLYLKHFNNLMNEIGVNKKTLKLEKIVFSTVPALRIEGRTPKKGETTPFKPYIQVFKNSKVIFNDLVDKKEPDVCAQEKDKRLIFNVGVEVSDDFLVRCRHFQTQKDRISVFRYMLNSAFILDEQVRVYRADLDIGSNIVVPDDFYIDFFFTKTANNSEDVENLLKIKNDCKSIQLIKWEVPKTLQEQKSTVEPSKSQLATNKSQNIENAPVVNKKQSEEEKNDQTRQACDKKSDEENAEERKTNKVEKTKIEKIIMNQNDHVEEEDDIDDYISKLEQ